jgi:hypothetical protein
MTIISIKDLDPAAVLVALYNDIKVPYAPSTHKKRASDAELLEKARERLAKQTRFEVLDLGRGYNYIPVDFGGANLELVDVLKYDSMYGKDKASKIIDALRPQEPCLSVGSSSDGYFPSQPQSQLPFNIGTIQKPIKNLEEIKKNYTYK